MDKNEKPVAGNCRGIFSKRLGIRPDYKPGEIIEIKGKKYNFPSFTDMHHASTGFISEYQVNG